MPDHFSNNHLLPNVPVPPAQVRLQPQTFSGSGVAVGTGVGFMVGTAVGVEVDSAVGFWGGCNDWLVALALLPWASPQASHCYPTYCFCSLIHVTFIRRTCRFRSRLDGRPASLRLSILLLSTSLTTEDFEVAFGDATRHDCCKPKLKHNQNNEHRNSQRDADDLLLLSLFMIKSTPFAIFQLLTPIIVQKLFTAKRKLRTRFHFFIDSLEPF